MKNKHYLTLFLAALMLLCTLTACAPNVEHRFDTTEYSAQAEATMRSISRELARMDSLLAGHNADLDAAFARYEDGKPGRPGGDVADTAITRDALNDWAARPGRKLYVYAESGTTIEEALNDWAARPGRKLYVYAESGTTIEEYLSVWYTQLGDVYSALNALSAEQWEKRDRSDLRRVTKKDRGKPCPACSGRGFLHPCAYFGKERKNFHFCLDSGARLCYYISRSLCRTAVPDTNPLG